MPPVITKEPSPSEKPINHFKKSLLKDRSSCGLGLVLVNFFMSCWLIPCLWRLSGSFSFNGSTASKVFETFPAYIKIQKKSEIKNHENLRAFTEPTCELLAIAPINKQIPIKVTIFSLMNGANENTVE